MKNSQTKTTGVLLATVAFVIYLFFAPATANAGWRSHYDEYPGTDSNVGTYLLVAAGAVAVIGIIALVKHNNTNAKHKTEDDKADSTKTDSGVDNSAQNEAKSAELMMITTEATVGSRLGLYIDVAQDDNGFDRDKAFDISDLTMKAGISLSF